MGIKYDCDVQKSVMEECIDMELVWNNVGIEDAVHAIGGSTELANLEAGAVEAQLSMGLLQVPVCFIC